VLLLIIYYIFAVIGTNLFASLSPEYFGTLGKSAYSLFQITMADDIGNISRPLLLSAGASAVIYFVSFVALSSILVLNVIVGVVVDSMEEVRALSRNSDNKRDSEKIKVMVKSKNEDDDNEEVLQEIRNLEQQLEKLKNIIVK
jgi:voltage-gated sodium channel